MATLLQTFMTNLDLTRGHVPCGHVPDGNKPFLALQWNLGFQRSRGQPCDE